MSFRNLFIRLLIVVCILIIYLYPFKIFRKVLFQHTVSPALVEQNEAIQLTQNQGKSMLYVIESQNNAKTFTIKAPFGLFFLIGLSGLIFINSSRKYYYMLLAIQLLLGFMAILFFRLGLNYGSLFYFISDLLVRYLTPLLSLSIPLIAIIERKYLARSA